MIVGVTAIRLNSTTSRICSREPARPRRRSAHTCSRRLAISAPSASSRTRSRLSSVRTVLGCEPEGRRPGQRQICRDPGGQRRHRQAEGELMPQTDPAGPHPNPPHQLHARPLTGYRRELLRTADPAAATGQASSTRQRHAIAGNSATRCCYFSPRTTGMSNSRIFLRKVLRLRPNRCAALIWLPRVAPRVKTISGRSTSRSTRS